MPLPKPNLNESEDHWLGRCMGNPTMLRDFPDRGQRFAVCNQIWRDRNKDVDMHGLDEDLDLEFFDEFGDTESKRLDFDAELKAEDDESGTFIGFASTFNNRDLVDDIVMPGAFKRSLKRRPPKKVKMLNQHRFDQLLGIWKEMEETDKGLKVTGRLNLEKQIGRDAFSDIKFGALDGLSIGFRIPKNGAEIDSDTNVRKLKQIDLIEVSLVTFPANPRATITSAKAVVSYQNLPIGPRDRRWTANAAIGRIRRWADAVDAPNSRYRRAFVLVTGDTDNFGSYKLPIADVIDGSLVAIPRAIFAAAGSVQGARDGVDATDAEKAGARRHLSRYYAKMREEFEDENIIAPWERRSFDEAYREVLSTTASCIETLRDFENFLREAGFSNSEAKAIIAKGPRKALGLREAGEGSVLDETFSRWAEFRKGLKASA